VLQKMVESPALFLLVRRAHQASRAKGSEVMKGLPIGIDGVDSRTHEHTHKTRRKQAACVDRSYHLRPTVPAKKIIAKHLPG